MINISYSTDGLAEFCEKESTSSDRAADNLAALPSLIESRFTHSGRLMIIRDDDRIVGCSGVYLSDFSNKVALLGARSWLTREYRSQSIIRDLVLPIQKTWAIEHGAENLALSFNFYNKNLRTLFMRNIVARSERTKDMLFYNNLTMLDFPVLIKSTPQLVIYEAMSDWHFDWKKIGIPDEFN